MKDKVCDLSNKDCLKIYILELISKHLKLDDYYGTLGFIEDLKNEWTRLNMDKVEK